MEGWHQSKIWVTAATDSLWRQGFGGQNHQVRRLKELDAETMRLRRAVFDLTVEKLFLKEVAREPT